MPIIQTALRKLSVYRQITKRRFGKMSRSKKIKKKLGPKKTRKKVRLPKAVAREIRKK
jgi:hypothetical protein